MAITEGVRLLSRRLNCVLVEWCQSIKSTGAARAARMSDEPGEKEEDQTELGGGQPLVDAGEVRGVGLSDDVANEIE